MIKVAINQLMAITAAMAAASRMGQGNRVQACNVPVLKVSVVSIMSVLREDDDGQLAVASQYGKHG